MFEGLIIANLILIFYQDIKSKLVYWFLFPSLAFLVAYVHGSHVSTYNFMVSIAINMLVVAFLMLSIFIYSKLWIKRNFFNEVFGMGDLLFFSALALGFPTATFIILFVFSILFSLIIGILISTKESIPLAGLMSLFILVIFLINWKYNLVNLYLI